MLDHIRKALTAAPAGSLRKGAVTNQEVARWAAGQRLAMVAQSTDGYFDLGGDLQGQPWRLECGMPTRDYVRSLELRGRAEVGADPDAAVMVLSRSLKEALESQAYDELTDTLQTTVGGQLPEEMRWLAMYEEVSWPVLPPLFAQRFAVVAERAQDAQRWIDAAVVSQMLHQDTAEPLDARMPLLVMLVRGKVYLRMAHMQRTLAEIAYATAVLRAAAEAAMRNVSAAQPKPLDPH